MTATGPTLTPPFGGPAGPEGAPPRIVAPVPLPRVARVLAALRWVWRRIVVGRRR